MTQHGRSDKWNVARKMPPLRHSHPGTEFDIQQSDVARWLVQQPEIMQLVFWNVKGKDIVFDPETGLWRGVDYAHRPD